MNLEQKLQIFQNITTEEQIKICIKILSVAVKSGNIKANLLLDKVQSGSVLSKTLDIIYINFLKAHIKTQEQKKYQELGKYEYGQQYIKTLKENEMAERKIEMKELDINTKLGELLIEEKKIIVKKKKSGLWKTFVVLLIITLFVLGFFFRDILINYIGLWLNK